MPQEYEGPTGGSPIGQDGPMTPSINPAATTPATTWTWNAASTLTVAGAAAVFIGAFLPWASVGAFSKAGTDGDGVLTLLLSIGAAGFGVPGIRGGKKGLLIGSLVCAALALVIGGIDMADIGSMTDAPFGLEVKIGGGLYLTVAGAIAGVFGAALAIRGAATNRA